MEATALLTADHNRVRGLFTRWQAAADADDLVEARRVSLQILSELDVHTSIEEKTFYPAVRNLSDEIGATVDEGVAEHQVVKQLMTDVRSLPVDDPQWKAKMTVLIENVEHHAREEEDELFPHVRGKLNAKALADLGKRLDEDKRRRGAPASDANIDLTTSELHDLATEQQIPGRAAMDHDELAATVAPRD